MHIQKTGQAVFGRDFTKQFISDRIFGLFYSGPERHGPGIAPGRVGWSVWFFGINDGGGGCISHLQRGRVDDQGLDGAARLAEAHKSPVVVRGDAFLAASAHDGAYKSCAVVDADRGGLQRISAGSSQCVVVCQAFVDFILQKLLGVHIYGGVEPVSFCVEILTAGIMVFSRGFHQSPGGAFVYVSMRPCARKGRARRIKSDLFCQSFFIFIF